MNLRPIYAEKAISQIPRLLSCQDRNLFSPTYGCMNREYWLCRATDFPSSIAQFGTHALALAYSYEMPGNIYYKHPKVLEWALAGMEYWTKIQHGDGSFDEFYPNERGWAGPTGFLVYAMCDSYRLLKDHVPASWHDRFLTTVHKAGLFLSGTDESGVLANHHAMAVLPMYEAFLLTQDKKIETAFKEKLDIFFSFCHEEGWCLEYDGADPGYLSATVSFMGKLAKHYKDERFDPFLAKWVNFCSYFVYPNGHYAGTMGSRQTLHFYPHGFELLASQNPLAARVADRMLEGLQSGALVPPEIQEERYSVYRIPEFLLAYVDFGERPEQTELLPYERAPFVKYFPGARIWVEKKIDTYTLINAAKGGVVKHFSLDEHKLKLNNCGIWGKIRNGGLLTSQWVDEKHQVEVNEGSVSIKGNCHKVPAKIFTPWKFILFRVFCLLFGWHERLAYILKGIIRKILMLGNKPLPIRFDRKVEITNEETVVSTMVWLEGPVLLEGLAIGDEFPARYVPQSRYFQPQELDVRGYLFSNAEIEQINRKRSVLLFERYRNGSKESLFEARI